VNNVPPIGAEEEERFRLYLGGAALVVPAENCVIDT